MKKWYLINVYAPESPHIQEREVIFHCERENLPTWTSCTPGFDTEAELREYCKLPDWKCCKCGGEVTLTYYGYERMIEHKMCFHCDHFREQKELMLTNPNKMVINGGIYTIVPESKGGFKGYGGRLFRIRKFGQEQVLVTTNLWHQGDVPKVWREEMPDTAEFINL